MKNSIKAHCPQFNTSRMLQDYTDNFYIPAARGYEHLSCDNMECAVSLADWKQEIAREWMSVRFEEVNAGDTDALKVGDELLVEAYVRLDNLTPDDVRVELYHGPLDTKGQIFAAEAVQMEQAGRRGDAWVFRGSIHCVASGRHGYMVRVLPYHEYLAMPYIPGMIVWG